MKIISRFAAVFLAIVLPVHLAASDIVLGHTLWGYTEDVDTATLDIALHVENTSTTPFDNLTLSYAPSEFIALEEVITYIGYLESGQWLDIDISIVTPLPFDENEFQETSLEWVGQYDDPNGTGFVLEFPIMDYNIGGAL